MIGRTEHELTEARIPYEVGIARYDDIAKGQMVGDDTGMLKILFHPDSLKVLGIHAIGESAAEIIHCRSNCDGAGGNRRVLPGQRLQLSGIRGGLQGRRLEWVEQALRYLGVGLVGLGTHASSVLAF
jgi:pyridine nucleotide-disulfide oxidoreductase